MKQANLFMLAVLGSAAIARAQPTPAPDGKPVPADAPAEVPAPPPAQQPVSPYPPPAADAAPSPPDDAAAGGAHRAARRPDKPLRFPEILNAPTGWLLPAGVLYSRNAIDTGGGVSSDHRVGLGDVAEFGVATTDQVYERDTDSAHERATQIQPYVTASFRMGIEEGRLFGSQPGVALGFRKSFERLHHEAKTRIAELTLVASKHFGPDVAVHLGGSVWDASLQQQPGAAMPPDPVTLHGHLADQLRAFGGFEARPLPRSEILVDLSWSPEFCYGCAGGLGTVKLKPELAWGVRYRVARFLHIASGVRVPDIGNANLLDAQIFGQITLTSYALSDAVEALK
jgi:hypothetical protein